MRRALIVVAAALVFAGAAVAAVHRHVLGRSVEGRAIVAYELGSPAGALKVLVVGCVHGNEPGGIAIARRLLRLAPPAGVDLWVVPSLNPDGEAAHTRGNAHGVDLNRNFPLHWKSLHGLYDSGPHALSEPESRIAYHLMVRLHPAVSIWFHQHLGVVDLSGGNAALERRYAQLVGLPARRLTRYPGSIVTWENARFRRSTAFVVELPGGEPSATAVARYARAVVALTRG
ncbi:MAG TPA: M14 family zinc carboxypeptidase [Gaiellaceae bacterium]|jgi:protein MpaA|nr:M14 family zinc carboxypeptidase [Gaiellaceae bacterium]